MCVLQAQQIRAMFPHIPLQAITLDLADTRSISQTVEHILNNAIYIPEGDSPSPHTPTSTQGTPIPPLAPEAPDSQEVPRPQHPGEEQEGENQSELRRRHVTKSHDESHELSQAPEEIRGNQSGASPSDEGGGEEREKEMMSFASLQRRKRELLTNARRLVSVSF